MQNNKQPSLPTLQVILQDSNVVCVAQALQIVCNLASGLRKEFAMYARSFVKELFEKLKDKASGVTRAAHAALLNFK